MLNIHNFTSRLKKLMEFYSISAAKFADTIEVPRSSISHILSGRNKPSLDFVLKIIETYQEVDLYWLLKGIGNFPKLAYNPTLTEKHTKDIENNLITTSKPKKLTLTTRETEKVLIFYKDNTFKEYKNSD